jgi:hypothetical protein
MHKQTWFVQIKGERERESHEEERSLGRHLLSIWAQLRWQPVLFPFVFIHWHGSGHLNLAINVKKLRKFSTCLPRRERERERERGTCGSSRLWPPWTWQSPIVVGLRGSLAPCACCPRHAAGPRRPAPPAPAPLVAAGRPAPSRPSRSCAAPRLAARAARAPPRAWPPARCSWPPARRSWPSAPLARPLAAGRPLVRPPLPRWLWGESEEDEAHGIG